MEPPAIFVSVSIQSDLLRLEHKADFCKFDEMKLS